MGSVDDTNADYLDIAAFDICSQCGFASADVVFSRDLNPYYRPWTELLYRLPSLLSSKSFRSQARSLPLLTNDRLSSKAEKRRGYQILAYFAQAYVFEDVHDPDPVVPAPISEPFLEICSYRGLQPVLSHIGMCLWNWKLNENDDPSSELVPVRRNENVQDVRKLLLKGNLDRFELYASFTGTHDEKIFSMVPLLVEVEGGRMVQTLTQTLQAASKDDVRFVTTMLRDCTEILQHMHSHLQIMHDQCRPDFFYTQLRPFIAGSKGLQNGFVFQRSSGHKISSKCVGASAGQSTLFQFLDLVFGIEHDSDLLREMQQYMPRTHRDFLAAISRQQNLRAIIQAHPQDEELIAAFNACVASLSLWRSKHIGIVTRYIMLPARKEMRRDRHGLDAKESRGIEGTGGSLPMPFLKRVRDETI